MCKSRAAIEGVSVVFKAPHQHPQLRVCHRHWKGPRVDTKIWRKFKWILNCLIMCKSQTRPKCTTLSQKIFKKIWPVSLTKNLGSAPGAARKILQGGRKVTKHGTAGDEGTCLRNIPTGGTTCFMLPLPKKFTENSVIWYAYQACVY